MKARSCFWPVSKKTWRNLAAFLDTLPPFLVAVWICRHGGLGLGRQRAHRLRR
jgi:hypothetical protein